jgi:DNA-binding NarL/FixJ family response regulator
VIVRRLRGHREGWVVRMNQFGDRRTNAGRRLGDQRRTQLLRAVGADLTHLRQQVARTSRDVPASLRRHLELIDQELARIARITDAATASVPTEPTDTDHLVTSLTQREWQCLGMMVRGMNTRAMAERLTVSHTTVRTHVQSILAKLGVNSRLEAVALTVRTGLVPR